MKHKILVSAKEYQDIISGIQPVIQEYITPFNEKDLVEIYEDEDVTMVDPIEYDEVTIVNETTNEETDYSVKEWEYNPIFQNDCKEIKVTCNGKKFSVATVIYYLNKKGFA